MVYHIRYFFFLSLLTIIVVLLTPTHSHAQVPTCLPLNGGGTACTQHPDLSLNKQIQTPDKKSFQENLTAESNRYQAGQPVVFKILVKNTSNNTLRDITVTESLPQFLTYTKGDGTYDANTRTFTAKMTLEKDTSKTLQLTAQIAPTIPSTPTPFCITNQAQAKQGNKTSIDTVVFCIQNEKTLQATTRGTTPSATGATTKGGLPVYNGTGATRTPSTGVETIGLLGILFSGVSGYLIRNNSRK